ncbi:hypothetical protein F4680DRAFT_435805 [Xylaria scruposa]|nr:hypothetical protein F4680DRAFT_435805 [Xylaria scruposa]
MRKQYDFWQCGHITRIDNGETVASDGDLSLIPSVDRDTIRKSFGDACPRCYTDLVLQRLQSIRLLLFDCGSQKHESVKNAERRVMALTEYVSKGPASETLLGEGTMVNYPAEFGAMMHHVFHLGIEVHTSAIDEFVAADRRLRFRASDQFVDRVNAIRDNAQLYFATGYTPIVRECMASIVSETSGIVNQLYEYEREELALLSDLDNKAAALKEMLKGYLNK